MQEKLSRTHKISYAVGDVGDGIQGAVVNTFLLFYLTSVCGLSGSLAGMALSITLVAESLTTPLFGYLSDNTRSHWGRRHPWMAAAALPLSLSIGLIFSVPQLDSQWVKFGYVLAVLIALRVSFSAFALPYAALGAELSKDYGERSVIVSYRNFFNTVGTILCFWLGFGVFLTDRTAGRMAADAYVSFGWVCAALVFASAATALFSSLGLRHRLTHDSHPRIAAGSNALREVRTLFQNPSFRILFAMILLFSVSLGVFESLSVHALTYFWAVPVAVQKNIFIVRAIGMMAGIPLYALLLTLMEKRGILILTIVMCSGLQLLLPALKIAGVLSADQTVQDAVLYGYFLSFGIGITLLFISFGSMVADAADEHDLRFGVRREGLYFAGLIFVGKCAQSLGTLIAGVSLDLVGFPTDIAANPSQLINPTVIRNLGLLYGPVAALPGLAAAAALIPYRLNRRRLAQIQQELAKRSGTD